MWPLQKEEAQSKELVLQWQKVKEEVKALEELEQEARKLVRRRAAHPVGQCAAEVAECGIYLALVDVEQICNRRSVSMWFKLCWAGCPSSQVVLDVGGGVGAEGKDGHTDAESRGRGQVPRVGQGLKAPGAIKPTACLL